MNKSDSMRAQEQGLDLYRLSDLNLIRWFKTEIQSGDFARLTTNSRVNLKSYGIIRYSRQGGFKLTPYGEALLTELKEGQT